jgi:hypothetical protein
MDTSKIAFEILKANSKRKINWVIFLVGLVIFIISYNYLRKANSSMINSVNSTNPFGVSYAEAYNSKQLDTIRDVPNAKRLPPFTPSTTPVNTRKFLGVSFNQSTIDFNYSYGSNEEVNIFNGSNSILVPTNTYSGGARTSYTCFPADVISDYGGFNPQLFFQKEDNRDINPVVVFSPYNIDDIYILNINYVENVAGILLYTDYDIVLDGVPCKPNFLFTALPLGSYPNTPPIIEPNSNISPGIPTQFNIYNWHATQWYSDPISSTSFQPSLVSGNPNPLAGQELVFRNGNLSQIPYLSLNQVHIITNEFFDSNSNLPSFFEADSASPVNEISTPMGSSVPSTSRSYYLRDPQNLSDGTCISLIGVDVQSSSLHPSSLRNTWMVLNGTWTVLPQFVFFDSTKNENPLVLYVLSNGANMPISLANLSNRWIVLSTRLTTYPMPAEPSMVYLNTNLGIPLNAFGRQGITIMSSSTLQGNTMPYRTILSAKGETGAYHWVVLYASWVAGFVGQAYITDANPTPPDIFSWNADANMNYIFGAGVDLNKTFVYIIFASQVNLYLPENPEEIEYSFILVVIGSQSDLGAQNIQIKYFGGENVQVLTSPIIDTIDQIGFAGLESTPQKWPQSSVSYLIHVYSGEDQEVNVSPPFGYSKSMLQSFENL